MKPWYLMRKTFPYMSTCVKAASPTQQQSTGHMACNSHQDKLQSSAAQSALHHQGSVLSCTTQGQMQSSAAQPILHHQEETKRVVTTRLTRGIIEDLIESIPYYDQIINSMV